jgi:hypothetical protein
VVGSRTGYREEDEDRRREGGHPTCRSRPHRDQRYRLLASSAALRILSLIASLAPFRYPVPYPTIHAATAQPKMKSQVKTSWYRPHHLHCRALGVKRRRLGRSSESCASIGPRYVLVALRAANLASAAG